MAQSNQILPLLGSSVQRDLILSQQQPQTLSLSQGQALAQTLSLSNPLAQPMPPPTQYCQLDLSSGDSKYSLDQHRTTLRGAEPPPPTTRFLNCGCVNSCLKFGIPFLSAVSIGAALNYFFKIDDHKPLVMFGAFLQAWIPIIFILCYLRWRYFRVVITAELVAFFMISFLFIFPYAFGYLLLSEFVANQWNIVNRTMSDWLTVNRFFLICLNSFIFVGFVLEIYKITFLCTIYKRKIIASPTALIIYGVVISSSASSAMEALFISHQSVWVGIVVIILALPLNIATGVYQAMYFATKRFAGSNIASHSMSIDSMDITIEYNTKKNQVSSQFTFASRSNNKKKEFETQHVPKSKSSDTNTLVVRSNGHDASNNNSNNHNIDNMCVFDEDMEDIDDHLGSYSMVHSPTTYKTYSDAVEPPPGKRYIVNFDQKAGNAVFGPYIMFMVCWLSHSIIQLLLVFVDALFRECYPNELFKRAAAKDGDVLLCKTNTTFWVALLWMLIVLCLIISLSFIGYIRHLWLLYFKDGIKVNVHYLLMCNQVNLPRLCCKCCYFCEIHSVFDEYGVLLSSVRDARLSTNERVQYQHMKHQLDNIT
eukprot:61582_1